MVPEISHEHFPTDAPLLTIHGHPSVPFEVRNLLSQNSASDFRNNGFVISEGIISWQYSSKMPFITHTYSNESRGRWGKGGRNGRRVEHSSKKI